jgi:hypothetical protein
MAIRLLPTPPKRTDDPTVFIPRADAIMTALPGFVDDANALAAQLNSVAAGTAYVIPYKFSTTLTDADPGAGWLRFNSATQNTTSTLRIDLLGSDGIDYTSLIDTMDQSSSGSKGTIKVVKVGDPTKFVIFNVVSRTTVAGYRNLAVNVLMSSTPNPFTDSDTVLLLFQRTGDVGSAGTLNRRTVSVANDLAPSPNIANTDCYEISALAGTVSISIPTGTPQNGQSLWFRIRDNGTARTVSYNPIYRASVELPFPSTTVVGKWLYLGFVYNATDARWDLVASIGNM